MEFQGEKLLLQFPRSVSLGQSIAIKVEQTHPNLVLKLTGISSPNPAQIVDSDNLAKEASPSNIQGFDKTSIQRPATHSQLRSSASSKDNALGIKSEQIHPGREVAVLLSKVDLNQLGIQVGKKESAGVLRVVDGETVQVRYNNSELTIKHAALQKFQSGDPVYIQAKAHSPGKFVLAVERIDVPSSPERNNIEKITCPPGSPCLRC